MEREEFQGDERDRPECLTPVPARARRRGFCTSELVPLPDTADAGKTRAPARAARPGPGKACLPRRSSGTRTGTERKG